MAESLVITVDPAQHGLRLDRGLADSLPDRSRSEVQRWIKEGRVLLHGEPARPSAKLAAGDVVTIALPDAPRAVDLAGEALPLAIVYEDDDLLVIDKPAGMVVHPAPGHSGGTLVNAVLHHCPGIAGVGGERRPGIVHRLDKDTSGLIVVAKHDGAMRNLQAQFKARTVYKEYLALLEGRLQPEQGRISAPIGRHPTAASAWPYCRRMPRVGPMVGKPSPPTACSACTPAPSTAAAPLLRRFRLSAPCSILAARTRFASTSPGCSTPS